MNSSLAMNWSSTTTETMSWENFTVSHHDNDHHDEETQYEYILEVTADVMNNMIMVFLIGALGCNIDLQELKAVLKYPPGFLIGLTCQFYLLPLVAFSLAMVFSLEPAHGLSLMILACCPEGALSNLFTYWTESLVCHCVCMTTISTFFAFGMMPLNLFIYSRVWTDVHITIPFLRIATTLGVLVVSLGVGVFARWWKKEWMVFVTRVSMCLMWICIAGYFVARFLLFPNMHLAEWRLWICAAALPILSYSVGYNLAFILRQPHRKCRTIAFEMGSQNASLAHTLIMLTFRDSDLFQDMLYIPFLYKIFIYVDSFVVVAIYHIIARYKRRNSGSHDVQDQTGTAGKDDSSVSDEGIVADVLAGSVRSGKVDSPANSSEKVTIDGSTEKIDVEMNNNGLGTVASSDKNSTEGIFTITHGEHHNNHQ